MAARRRKARQGARKTRRRARRPRRDPLARERALETLSIMRSEGLSLTRASRKAQTTAATVRKYAGSALVRNQRGQYAATPSDRLTREIRFLTPQGPVEIKVRSSRRASEVARHWAAVDRFLRTGLVDGLTEFRGKSFRAGSVTYAFVTDPDDLERLANAGVVSFERLYTQRA